MAGQPQAIADRQDVYGSIGHAVFARSLSEAICAVGVPTLEIGLSAAKTGLIKLGAGEGTMHFEWDKAALDKLTVKTLETLLIGLRQAAGTPA